MAHLQERATASGQVRYRVVYRDASRKERPLTFLDKATAEHWLNVFNAIGVQAAEELLAATLAAPPETPTVRQALDAHIEGLTGVTDGTRDDYKRHAARDIYPTLGDLPVTALSQDTIRSWMRALSTRPRPLASKTIKNRHALISALCTQLVADGMLKVHPSRGIRMPAGDPKRMICLSAKEYAAIHTALPEYWQPFFDFLVSTGARLGEASALVVDDVRFDDDMIRVHIWRAWKHTRGKPVLGPPKTGAGDRIVEIAYESPAAEILQKAVAGRRGTDLLFTAPRGGMIRQADLHGDIWGPTMTKLRKAGVTRIPRMHDLRHTAISWMLAAGVPPLDVAYTAGHEDVTMTLNRYGHAMPSNRHLAGRATAAALASVLESPRVENPADPSLDNA